MAKHWSASAVDRIRGSIKEAIGKITGNTKLETQGANEKVGVKPPDPVVQVDQPVRDVGQKGTSAPMRLPPQSR